MKLLIGRQFRLGTVLLGICLSGAISARVFAQPACVPAPAGLVGWWAGESDATDSVGGNNGTMYGAVSIVPGKVGNGFGFTNWGYIAISNSPALNFTNALTLEMWYETSQSNDDYYGIIDKRGTTSGPCNYGINFAPGYGMGLYYRDPTTSGGDDPGSWYEASRYSPAPGPGAFHHLAGTFEQLTNDMIRLETYLDGQLVKSEDIPGNFTNTLNNAPVVIGAIAGQYGSIFRGIIDEVSIYNRALAADEIQAIYDAGSAGKCAVRPAIISQPTDQKAPVGGSATFTVGVAGTPPLTYQWLLEGSPLAGQTGSTLTLAGLQLTNTGNYSVLVTNATGWVASSNAALTVAVQSCAAVPAGIVGWWKGEADASDSVGGNHGTMHGAVSIVPAKVGNGFSFTGFGYISIPNQPWLNFTNALTIEMWYETTQPNNVYYGIIDKRGTTSGPCNYGINLSPINGLGLFYRDPTTSGGDDAGSWYEVSRYSPAPGPGAFHHLAGTFQQLPNSVIRLKTYLDGQLVKSEDISGNFTNTLNTAPVIIGATAGQYPSGEIFLGTIDEVSIYSRALAGDEINAIYSAGSAGKCVTPVAPFVVTQPGDQTVTAGQNATFSVVAAGTAPLSYQWQRNGSPVDGATDSSLTLANVQRGQQGLYSVVVSNALDSVTSSNALLTVNPGPANVTIAGAAASAGGTITLPVTLNANGNENALGFSLNFNAALLQFTGVTLGSGGSNAFLVPNTASAASGKVGVAIALNTGEVFAEGSYEMALVSFITALVTNHTSTAVTFADDPIARQVVDAAGNPLPATYTGSTVTLPAAEFEADLSPRPGGDKAVTITDWVLLGRFVARLDFPTNADEFERADCAPRETQGDGDLTIIDWVQAGRYAAKLDPPTAMGGPASPVSPLVASPALKSPRKSGAAQARQVKVLGPVVFQGQSGTVAVELEAQGDENALAFSLSVDPSVLAYTGANLGGAASGAVLNVNGNDAAAGRVGFVLALSPGNAFAAGSKQLVNVTFRALRAGANAVVFANGPVPCGVASATATSLAADYIAGAVTVNPPPSLRIARAGQTLTLAWPAGATNFVLQESSDFLSPASWTVSTLKPGLSNGEQVVTVPVTSTNRFYRLLQQ